MDGSSDPTWRCSGLWRSGNWPISVFGSREQFRDLTYVQDVVPANLAAAASELPSGAVVNIAGGGPLPVNRLISVLDELMDLRIDIGHEPEQPGAVQRTGGGDRCCIRESQMGSGDHPAERALGPVNWHRTR